MACISPEEDAALILCSMKHQKVALAVEVSKGKLRAKIQSFELAVKSHGCTPRPLPLEMLRVVAVGGEWIRPLEKKLYDSDVKDRLGRLMLAKSYAEDFLIPKLKKDENIDAGIGVKAYNAKDGREFEMIFIRWSNGRYIYYVLAGKGWKEFYHMYDLKARDSITVWMCRNAQTNKLCFVLDHSKSVVPVSRDVAELERGKRRRIGC
ncbi:hypothetical protein Nepgr_019728 [Nepenthes gracilis]|uniref:TF-B3 domain-containing protein n=1 Tax=Nepenthes gracilis TaxID=150966 RepID=A0AAD3SVK2_NEPGR|nr:hypothetical protein Nepgr_019728 [Nepenthes gracilis]